MNVIKGYLYSMWSGKLRVHEGYVEESKYARGRYHFHVTRGGKPIKRLMCSVEPGVITNATVWLPERDDQKAIDILVQYELEQIEKCKEKIEHHENKIETLKKGIEK